jgi:hypothetical protein
MVNGKRFCALRNLKERAGCRKAARALNSNDPTPPKLGALSIQRLLIDLQIRTPGAPSVVPVEDDWFLRNAVALR